MYAITAKTEEKRAPAGRDSGSEKGDAVITIYGDVREWSYVGRFDRGSRARVF